MAWTYSGNPATSGRDEIRFLVGDTDQEDQLLLDGEIDYILTVYPRVSGTANYRAAAVAARSIAGKFSKAVDKTVGSLSLNASRKAQAFNELADKFDEQALTGVGQAAVGLPVLTGGGSKFLMPTGWDGSNGTDGSIG